MVLKIHTTIFLEQQQTASRWVEANRNKVQISKTNLPGKNAFFTMPMPLPRCSAKIFKWPEKAPYFMKYSMKCK